MIIILLGIISFFGPSFCQTPTVATNSGTSSSDPVPVLLSSATQAAIGPGDVIPNLILEDVRETVNTAATVIDGALVFNGNPVQNAAGSAITLATFNSAVDRLLRRGYSYPRQCYQCSYSPPKRQYPTYTPTNNYFEERYPTNRYYQGQTYQQTQGPREGGWDKCMNPFTRADATYLGIDTWWCHSNCYIRREKSGNVFRGCFKGEYGVNPNKLGCHLQSGSIYCFCKGDKCNNGHLPEANFPK